MRHEDFCAAALQARESWSTRLARTQRQRTAVAHAVADMPAELRSDAGAVYAHLAKLGPAALGLDRLPCLEAVKGALRDLEAR